MVGGELGPNISDIGGRFAFGLPNKSPKNTKEHYMKTQFTTDIVLLL